MGACTSKPGPAKVAFVTPIPCWVIKTKTVESSAKVFLNVVKHDEIPKSSDPMEPRIFIGHEKVSINYYNFIQYILLKYPFFFNN